jgi:hypothetical protein
MGWVLFPLCRLEFSRELWMGWVLFPLCILGFYYGVVNGMSPITNMWVWVLLGSCECDGSYYHYIDVGFTRELWMGWVLNTRCCH